MNTLSAIRQILYRKILWSFHNNELPKVMVDGKHKALSADHQGQTMKHGMWWPMTKVSSFKFTSELA
jgi:hypothetical protein